ncbi:MAG: WG repeat-containing protein [Alistipes sp.]|nr:WG repeat-containing protein [Alistipes sp.]
MHLSIRQYLETMDDPEGLTRTLGPFGVCRLPDGSPARWVGNSAVVFKISCGGKFRMLKCYTRPMRRLEAIYGERFLPEEIYLWQPDGNGVWGDAVIDDWIEGATLREELLRAVRSGDTERLAQLAAAFDRMALGMLRSPTAHGDLKPENILVGPEGALRPIDFDCAFLPAFAGERSPELGTAAYQHPARTPEDFDAAIDDYSIALISTTLHALALNPGLLALGDTEEGVLLVPRTLLGGRSEAYAETLALFERAGDAVRYRIARLLRSPLLRLPTLRRLLEYAVEGPSGQADRSELFVRDGLWGFRTAAGETIPPLYDAAFDFTEGLAAVRTGRCWHFIDGGGRVAIDCAHCTAVKPFAGGRAVVVHGGERRTIDRRGREALWIFEGK